MGYSRSAAAAALGWHPSQAKRVIALVDPDGTIAWPGPNQSRCRRCTPRRSPREALRRYYAHGPGRKRLATVEVGDEQVPRVLLHELAHPGVTPEALRWRLTHGWSVPSALHTPPHRRGA